MDKSFSFDNEIINACLGEYCFVFYRNLETNQSLVRILAEKGRYDWESVYSVQNDYFVSIRELIKDKVHPEDKEATLKAYDEEYFMSELRHKKSFSVYYRRKFEDGKYRWEKLRVSKAENADEIPKNLVFCCSDANNEVTEKQKIEEKRREYFYVMQALGREYSSLYYVNLDTGELTTYDISNRIEGMFGDTFFKTDFDTAAATYIKKAICDEDKEMMTEVLSREFLIKQIKSEDHFTWIYRNESDEYCEMKCVRINSEEHNIVVMGFAVKDAEIRLEKESKERMEFHLALLDGLSSEYESLFLIDESGKMSPFRVGEDPHTQNAVRDACETKQFETSMVAYVNRFVDESDKDRLLSMLKKEVLDNLVPENGIYPITFKRVSPETNEESIYLQMCFAKADAPSGEHFMLMGFRNVDVLVKEENRKKELFQNAIKDREIDIMTGLRNRFCYEHSIQKYADKKCNWISCVYIDVDGLHELNNTKGHDEGDKLIKTVADAIVQTWGNLNAFRTGGDEFIIFLFDWDTSQLVDEIKKLKEVAEQKNYSISVGYSQDVIDKMNIQYLIKDAERMMYAEKLAHHKNLGIVRE